MKSLSKTTELKVIAFFFDSNRIEDCCYGDVVFEHLIKGKEITFNSEKVICSKGDIVDRSIYDDINPFIIRDDVCTIKTDTEHYSGNIYVFVFEDIEAKIAAQIDTRLKTTFPAYIGMSSVDVQSTDPRKQFWKRLLRCFSINREIITCFGCEEEDTPFFISTPMSYGYTIAYDDSIDNVLDYDEDSLLLTRQSSYIHSVSQLEIVDGKPDSDRGIMEMNFSLVKEVEIAGVQIWKSIEDINQIQISKHGEYTIPDYIFMSLYEAAQGVERLLKIIIEMMNYSNTSFDKKHIDKLLFSHNHCAMFDLISKNKKASLKPKSKEFLNILYKFYSEARYNRFHYNKNDVLEVELLRSFGKDISEENFDEKIKHQYGKALGNIAQTLYELIIDISHELNIYIYEMHTESVAKYALNKYFGDDLYETLKRIERSKKEFIWYLIKNGREHQSSKMIEDIEPLSFESCYIPEFIRSLITNENSYYSIHDIVSNEYEEMIDDNKPKWLERINAIDSVIGNPYLMLDDEEYFEPYDNDINEE